MKKSKHVFECRSCGHREPKWLGRCPACSEWNTLEEVALGVEKSQGTSSRAPHSSRSLPLSDIHIKEDFRVPSGIGEMDRVLGGGIMGGSTVLIGGEPGIGKSTLMLQVAGNICTSGTVLYISGEESPEQLKLRAERLRITRPGLEVLCETDLDKILSIIEKKRPVLIILDSIQTLISSEIGAVPGTVNQLKYSCHELISWSREHDSALFLIAHVTKEGAIAGPKVIEHMVDTVLYFDHSDGFFRFLRAVKNRFGSVDEVGLFTMEQEGLREIGDPSTIFLESRKDGTPPGISVAPVFEGSRILLVEIQALTVPAKGGISRTYSERIDTGRVSRIAAILEKHLNLRFHDQDVYVNIAGGIRVNEVGIELPLAAALYSARTGIPVPEKTAIAGELTLAGEIRTVSHMPRRIKTTLDMGFIRIIGPPRKEERKEHMGGYLPTETIAEAMKKIFPSGS